MELVPVGKQLERNKPRFILDEMIQPRKHERLSPKFLPVRAVVRPGSHDWLLLERAKDLDVTIITCDKGLVIRALMENQDIIYQDQYGNRFQFYGRYTKLVERNCEQRKGSEIAREKKLNKLVGYYYQNYYFL